LSYLLYYYWKWKGTGVQKLGSYLLIARGISSFVSLVAFQSKISEGAQRKLLSHIRFE
jgi:hypothetical protein